MVGVSATRRRWLAGLAGHVRHCLRCREGHYRALAAAEYALCCECPIEGGCCCDPEDWPFHCQRMLGSPAYGEAALYWIVHRASPDLRRRVAAVIRREARACHR